MELAFPPVRSNGDNSDHTHTPESPSRPRITCVMAIFRQLSQSSFRFADRPVIAQAVGNALLARMPGSSAASGKSYSCRHHHTRHCGVCTIGWPSLQPKACWNSGIFDNGLFTRNLANECGLLST